MLKSARGVAALALAALAQPVSAAGDLLVAPTRVVLDSGRGTEVILSNIGNAPATYRISLELRRMDAQGQLDEVAAGTETAKEQATLAMISYAPRRVVLPPNQPQAIRIGVRAPADLPDGEYRAHMLFRAIPDAVAPAEAVPGSKGLSIALTPIYGITIPVIVRKGSLNATAAISAARMTMMDGKPALAFDLARTGDRSVYGRIRVTRPGVARPLLEARGIAVYAEVARRTVTLPVPPEVAAALPGPARIEYLEDNDAGGTIAEAQVVIR